MARQSDSQTFHSEVGASVMHNVERIVKLGDGQGMLVSFSNGTVATSRRDSVTNMTQADYWPDLHDPMDAVEKIYSCSVMDQCLVVSFARHHTFHSGDIENVRPSEIKGLPSLRGSD